MYVNKCIKCGAEFETKNPKRVICPNCLYADKSTGDVAQGQDSSQPLQSYSSYSTEQKPRSYDRPQQGGYRNNYSRDNNGGYNRGGQGGGYSGGGYSGQGGSYGNRESWSQGGFPQQGMYPQQEQWIDPRMFM